MLHAFDVPLPCVGERTERQHSDKPQRPPAGAPASEGKFVEATQHAMPLKGQPPSYV